MDNKSVVYLKWNIIQSLGKTNYDIHRYLDGPGNNLSEWSDSDPEKQITHVFSQFLVISFEFKDLCILSGTPVEIAN